MNFQIWRRSLDRSTFWPQRSSLLLKGASFCSSSPQQLAPFGRCRRSYSVYLFLISYFFWLWFRAHEHLFFFFQLLLELALLLPPPIYFLQLVDIYFLVMALISLLSSLAAWRLVWLGRTNCSSSFILPLVRSTCSFWAEKLSWWKICPYFSLCCLCFVSKWLTSYRASSI